MAFRKNSQFHDFLTTCCRDTALRVRGPGENFILEESDTDEREQQYLMRVDATRGAAAYTYAFWAVGHKAHGDELVAAKASGSASVTFTDSNRANLTLSSTLEPNQQVIRLESVVGLFSKVYAGDYADVKALCRDLERWTAAQKNGTGRPDDFPLLEDWTEGLNRHRDQRPVWVTTYTAARALLEGKGKWAVRLRDALGLAHFSGTAAAPYPVVLLQYPLQRVFDAHLAAPGWAAVPTVLDDVPGSAGINYSFFPPARAAMSSGMGAAVDLNPDHDSQLPEFLHARIDYRLEDFKRVAQISSPVDDTIVARSRVRHLSHYQPHLRYAADLP